MSEIPFDKLDVLPPAELSNPQEISLHLGYKEVKLTVSKDKEGRDQIVDKDGKRRTDVLHVDLLIYEDDMKDIVKAFEDRGVYLTDSQATRVEDGEDYEGYVEVSCGALNDALEDGRLKFTEAHDAFEGIPHSL